MHHKFVKIEKQIEFSSTFQPPTTPIPRLNVPKITSSTLKHAPPLSFKTPRVTAMKPHPKSTKLQRSSSTNAFDEEEELLLLYQ